MYAYCKRKFLLQRENRAHNACYHPPYRIASGAPDGVERGRVLIGLLSAPSLLSNKHFWYLTERAERAEANRSRQSEASLQVTCNTNVNLERLLA